jgi:predicted ATPase
MERLPTGTLTFLFTDIVGSTRLLVELGPDRYAAALLAHRAALAEPFERHGGVTVDSQGDAMFVVFRSARAAAAAAADGQRALAGGPVRVRMGMHTGDALVADDAYVGIDVHRGARVGALAHPGQVLLTQATAALVDEPLRDLGLHRLKDFDGAVRLYQLGVAGFPALRTPGTVDLPPGTTPFFGRIEELARAAAVLFDRDPAVLTIVGPGGAGKTRFAIELARHLVEDADGGTRFVPLAAVRDANLVLGAIAAVTGAASADREAIAASIAGRRTRLVLDNLEQLLPGVASVLASLVESAPDLRLVITSREPLRIRAEIELLLDPLVEEDAVELFLARAREVGQDLTDDTAVRSLCRRLDHLPLAIELAAARTKVLTPAAILGRLVAAPGLLVGPRDVDPRHATIEATIAWSYDLLDEVERRVFRSLGVFRDGCTVESAEAVGGTDIETVASLLDKSLLRRRTTAAGEDRLAMLDLVRQFAAARLVGSGELEDVRRRHAQRLLAIAEMAHLSSAEQGHETPRHDLVTPEGADVEAALEWAVSADTTTAVRLLIALESYWVTGGPVAIRTHAEALLAMELALPAPLSIGLLRVGGGLAIMAGDVELGTGRYVRALAEAVAGGDVAAEAGLLARRALTLAYTRDREAVVAATTRIEAIDRVHPVTAAQAQAAGALGALAEAEGDLAEAARLFTISATSAAACRFKLWELWMLAAAMGVALRRGRLDEARGPLVRGLELGRALGDRRVLFWLITGAARVMLDAGDRSTAGELWSAVATRGFADHPDEAVADEFESIAAPLRVALPVSTVAVDDLIEVAAIAGDALLALP